MKPKMIVSVRSSHMDPLPATAFMEAIKYLHKNFPSVPITVCYKADPKGFDLTRAIDGLKDKIDLGRSRYRNQTLSINEANHDKSVFWLLKAIRLYNIQVIPSDLSGISEIPLGDPRAEQKRREREDAMTTALIQAITHTEGGIILDFGGISHTTGIQQRLFQHPLFQTQDTRPESQFFCVYSEEGQQYIPADFRLMQFQGVSSSAYPYGLTFLSSELEPGKDQGVIKRLNDLLTTFCQKYQLTSAMSSLQTSTPQSTSGTAGEGTHSLAAAGSSLTTAFEGLQIAATSPTTQTSTTTRAQPAEKSFSLND